MKTLISKSICVITILAFVLSMIGQDCVYALQKPLIAGDENFRELAFKPAYDHAKAAQVTEWIDERLVGAETSIDLSTLFNTKLFTKIYPLGLPFTVRGLVRQGGSNISAPGVLRGDASELGKEVTAVHDIRIELDGTDAILRYYDPKEAASGVKGYVAQNIGQREYQHFRVELLYSETLAKKVREAQAALRPIVSETPQEVSQVAEIPNAATEKPTPAQAEPGQGGSVISKGGTIITVVLVALGLPVLMAAGGHDVIGNILFGGTIAGIISLPLIFKILRNYLGRPASKGPTMEPRNLRIENLDNKEMLSAGAIDTSLQQILEHPAPIYGSQLPVQATIPAQVAIHPANMSAAVQSSIPADAVPTRSNSDYFYNTTEGGTYFAIYRKDGPQVATLPKHVSFGGNGVNALGVPDVSSDGKYIAMTNMGYTTFSGQGSSARIQLTVWDLPNFYTANNSTNYTLKDVPYGTLPVAGPDGNAGHAFFAPGSSSLVFSDFNLGRDSHGTEIKKSYIVDLQTPYKVTETLSPPGAVMTAPITGRVIYDMNLRGNTIIGVYDLAARTQTLHNLPNFGFMGFKALSPNEDYLVASSPVNTVYAVPIAAAGDAMRFNLPVSVGGKTTEYRTVAASFTTQDTANITLANGKAATIKIVTTAPAHIELVRPPHYLSNMDLFIYMRNELLAGKAIKDIKVINTNNSSTVAALVTEADALGTIHLYTYAAKYDSNGNPRQVSDIICGDAAHPLVKEPAFDINGWIVTVQQEAKISAYRALRGVLIVTRPVPAGGTVNIIDQKNWDLKIQIYQGPIIGTQLDIRRLGVLAKEIKYEPDTLSPIDVSTIRASAPQIPIDYLKEVVGSAGTVTTDYLSSQSAASASHGVINTEGKLTINIGGQIYTAIYGHSYPTSGALYDYYFKFFIGTDRTETNYLGDVRARYAINARGSANIQYIVVGKTGNYRQIPESDGKRAYQDFAAVVNATFNLPIAPSGTLTVAGANLPQFNSWGATSSPNDVMTATAIPNGIHVEESVPGTFIFSFNAVGYYSTPQDLSAQTYIAFGLKGFVPTTTSSPYTIAAFTDANGNIATKEIVGISETSENVWVIPTACLKGIDLTRVVSVSIGKGGYNMSGTHLDLYTTALAVPAGWTRAASNPNYAFNIISNDGGINKDLYLKDLSNPSQQFLVGGGSVVRHGIAQYDVSPDGKLVAVAYHEYGPVVGQLSEMVFYRTEDLLAGKQLGQRASALSEPANVNSIMFNGNVSVTVAATVRGPTYDSNGSDTRDVTVAIPLADILAQLTPMPATPTPSNLNVSFRRAGDDIVFSDKAGAQIGLLKGALKGVTRYVVDASPNARYVFLSYATDVYIDDYNLKVYDMKTGNVVKEIPGTMIYDAPQKASFINGLAVFNSRYRDAWFRNSNIQGNIIDTESPEFNAVAVPEVFNGYYTDVISLDSLQMSRDGKKLYFKSQGRDGVYDRETGTLSFPGQYPGPGDILPSPNLTASDINLPISDTYIHESSPNDVATVTKTLNGIRIDYSPTGSLIYTGMGGLVYDAPKDLSALTNITIGLQGILNSNNGDYVMLTVTDASGKAANVKLFGIGNNIANPERIWQIPASSFQGINLKEVKQIEFSIPYSYIATGSYLVVHTAPAVPAGATYKPASTLFAPAVADRAAADLVQPNRQAFASAYSQPESGQNASFAGIIGAAAAADYLQRHTYSEENANASIINYINNNYGNDRVIKRLKEEVEPVFVRMPVEILNEAKDSDEVLYKQIISRLNALGSIPNIQVELYSRENPDDKIGKESYDTHGLAYKTGYLSMTRSKSNAITLLAPKEKDESAIRQMLQSSRSMQNSVIVPFGVGLKDDPSGIGRAIVLGTRLIIIAKDKKGNKEDAAFIDETIKGYEDLVMSCNGTPLTLNRSDILALVGNEIPLIVDTLLKIIRSIPIERVSIEGMHKRHEAEMAAIRSL